MIVIDITLIVLLVFCIFYCNRLSKRMRYLNISHNEIKAVADKASRFVDGIKGDISNLENISNKVETMLKDKIIEGEKVVDDLSFMIRRSEGIMETLESVIKTENALKSKVNNRNSFAGHVDIAAVKHRDTSETEGKISKSSVNFEENDLKRNSSSSKKLTLQDLLLQMSTKY